MSELKILGACTLVVFASMGPFLLIDMLSQANHQPRPVHKADKNIPLTKVSAGQNAVIIVDGDTVRVLSAE